jgi:predicted ester cyclase
MSSETNKAIVRRFTEEPWTQGRIETIDELCAPGYTLLHDGKVEGREDLKRAVGEARAAIPDLRCTIQEIVAEGDLVMYRWTMRGTQVRELYGEPGTGQEAAVTGFTMLRFADGKIVEDRYLSAPAEQPVERPA